MSNKRLLLVESQLLSDFYKYYESELLSSPDSLLFYLVERLDIFLQEAALAECFHEYINSIIEASLGDDDDPDEQVWANHVVSVLDKNPNLLNVLFSMCHAGLTEITQQLIDARVCLSEDWVLADGTQSRLVVRPYSFLSNGMALFTHDSEVEMVLNEAIASDIIAVRLTDFAQEW